MDRKSMFTISLRRRGRSKRVDLMATQKKGAKTITVRAIEGEGATRVPAGSAASAASGTTAFDKGAWLDKARRNHAWITVCLRFDLFAKGLELITHLPSLFTAFYMSK